MTEIVAIVCVLIGAALLAGAMAYAAIRLARQADQESFKALMDELKTDPPEPVVIREPAPKTRPLIVKWPKVFRADVPPAPVPPVPVPAPSPLPPPVPVAKLPDFIGVRLVSAKGRPLGKTKIHPLQRRPTLTHRTKDGLLSIFVAQERAADTGEWIYRRVGVERE